MDKEHLIRLTNNLYQLTILFPKKEPLRYKMRELADEILANSILYSNLYSYENPKKSTIVEKVEKSTIVRNSEKSTIVGILENLEILDNFFEVARGQNWVNPPELFSIQREYSKIKEYCLELKKENSFIPKLEKEVSAEKKKDLNERQQKILKILKEKEKAQVGEFKEIFPNVTKRTLRRDFRQLLKDGKIKRIGERNDTFYQLKEIT